MTHVGGELSDIQIKNICRKNNLSNFGGCYAKDEIQSLPTGKEYIINMEDHQGPGTHWVLLDTRDKRHFQYCDSFGVVPPTDIVNYARAHRARLTYNKVDMQSYHSAACGWYCLYLMAQMRNGRTMRDIIHHDFVNLRTMKPRRNNDQVLKEFFS